MAQRGVMVECIRCGNEQHEPRASKYPEDLFLETWHELHEIEADGKRLEAENRRLRRELERALSDAQSWRERADFGIGEAIALAQLLIDLTPARRSPFDE